MNNILKWFMRQDPGASENSMHREELRFKSPDGKIHLRCEVCKKTMPNQFQVEKHLWLHAKAEIYQCDVCPQKFQWKYQLTKHRVKIHHGGLGLDCDFCHRSYKRQSSLRYHLRCHAEELTCKVCERVLDDKDSFTRHVRSHRSRNKKTFKYKVCSDKFSSERLLIDHERRQSVEERIAEGASSRHLSETNIATRSVDEFGDMEEDKVKVEECEDQVLPVECEIKIEQHELPSNKLDQLIKVEIEYNDY